MAIIDESRGVLVVRIVYDGPALSGKTTSLRALARGVSSTVECPGELGGRTLFFDWVDYVGGLFEGRQIRCQIISVPGQRELLHRRKLLLETADAVVLVLDTREKEWDFSLGWAREVIPYCRSKDPPVGLVLQANKRDAPDAVKREDLGRALTGTPVAVVPSTATTGEGTREAFVLAVRLALDRVRALSSAGRLRTGKPTEDGPQDLLAKLRTAEQDGAAPVSESFAQAATSSLAVEAEPWAAAPKTPATEGAEQAEELLFTPDPLMPGGMIWPPVDGRMLLHEVASLGIRPARAGHADWCGSGSGFRFHSFSHAIFADQSHARSELIEWARLHSINAAHLSKGRAVILADAGDGKLRLWQIVRAEATLRERLALALALTNPEHVANEVVGAAVQLVAARESFAAASVQFPCTLWTIGSSNSYRPTFVGLMPERGNGVTPEPQGQALLERELSPHLRELRRARVDYDEVVARLGALAQLVGQGTPARWLSELATGL